MSSYPYELSDPNLAIHLTNNAIQKKDANYSKYEEGNILSLKQG
jgi:hypothetical protein